MLLQIASLHRYRRANKLGEAPSNATKDELLPGVLRHFNAQVSQGGVQQRKASLSVHSLAGPGLFLS